MIGVDSTRVVCPLFPTEEGGSIPASTLQLIYEACPRKYAAMLNQKWHSRLPRIEWQMISFAFHARCGDISYAVALWSTPTTNMVPSKWLELRRLAISTDAPKNTASSFLGWMVRYFKRNHPDHERLISYQDTAVHAGTIYRAAGWTQGRLPRKGDSGVRSHPSRFRPCKNGDAPLRSLKVRWEVRLKPAVAELLGEVGNE